MTLLLLLACSPLPESIPDAPGTFTDEADLRRLWLAASPDTLYRLFQLATGLEAWPDASCPAAEEDAAGALYRGGCTDSYGGDWLGEARRSETDASEELRMEGFGVEVDGAWVSLDAGGEQTVRWTADGFLRWARADEGSAQQLQLEAALDFSDGSDSFVAWLDLQATLDYSPTTLTAISGEIGVEGWGLAELAGDSLRPAGASCAYPADGSISLTGDGAATLRFGAPDPDDAAECGPCPEWSTGSQSGSLCEPLHYLALPYDGLGD